MTEEKEITVLDPQKTDIVPVDMPIMDKLLMAVSSGGMDITMVEKFMDLAERNQKREAEQAYHKAFAAFKANPPKIVKDKLVKYGTTSYKHATIGAVVSAIISGMSKYGLSHCWPMKQDGGNIIITCKITHELGHSESTSLCAGADQSGGKNAIQAICSTVTYLERYTLQAATGIAVLEEDDDGAGAENVTSPEKKAAPAKTKQEKKEGVSSEEIVALEKWIDAIDAFEAKTLDEWLLFDEQTLKPGMAGFSKTSLDKFNLARKEMASHLQEQEDKKSL